MQAVAVRSSPLPVQSLAKQKPGAWFGLQVQLKLLVAGAGCRRLRLDQSSVLEKYSSQLDILLCA